MRSVLSVAGSDSSGGAGIEADIKTISMHGVYASTAITALTAQNTMGVKAIYPVSAEFFGESLKCVFEDIYPDAIKIGMLADEAIIAMLEKKLLEYEAKNIVLDPVMVSTSGSRLIKESAISSLKQKLFPLSCVITPNLFEAEILGGCKINCFQEMKECARKIADFYHVNVLIKGGHLQEEALDFLVSQEGEFVFESKRIDNPNTHGTGCTLSSAIASNLALGLSLEESIKKAKSFVTQALEENLKLGKGRGPLNHLFGLK